MASGFGRIPVTNVQVTGGFNLINDGFGSYYALGPGSAIGSTTITFDPQGQFELATLIGGPYTPVAFADLPAGFQIIEIERVINATTNPPVDPNIETLPWPGWFNGWPTNSCPSWITSFGLSSADPTWDTNAYRTKLFESFTLFINASAPQAFDEVSWFTTDGTDYPYGHTEYVTNCLTFFWDDNGPIGPPLGPITNPEIDPGGPSVTVTPPPDTTIVEVQVPGETPIIQPVTPEVPVTIPLPPGAPVVTIIPQNPGSNPPGPSVIIPIDLNVSADGIPIDIAITSTLKAMRDPSGIYVLVPGKTHDTLYERAAGTTTATSTDVAIPRPFGTIGYIPVEE